MLPVINSINLWLTQYVYYPGDDKETVLQKKIWWLLLLLGLPFLVAGSLIIGNKEGNGIVITNILFLVSSPFLLLIFHFYKRGIEWYALLLQLGVVIISAVKVYLMGGLLSAGAAIFVGMIGPMYALILPNKKRAIHVFGLYMFLMIVATLIQQEKNESYLIIHYFLGFILGVTQIFFTLYYFTTQVDKLKSEEKQRMKELDEFKSKFYINVTHEFRTPLTIILGMADQIKKAPKQWLFEGLNMIKRNGQKLLTLTNHLLDLSKLDSKAMPVHMVQGDIAQYMKYIVESFHSLARAKRIHLALNIRAKEIMMDFDPDKIQNIVSNLLSNAIHFTPPGGSVRIAIGEEIIEEENSLLIKIEDTGPGISDADLPKIFDRYFQANNQQENINGGTGLGLALTKELVLLFNGSISVESTIGKGTTFSIQLPITNEAMFDKKLISQEEILPIHYQEKRPPLPAINASNKMVLLIIEDNMDVVKYLYSLLSADYQIEVASNGLEGLEKAINIIPDLIITDVMMPIMDGFEFCEKLKNNLKTSHIPVIMLTARADMESKITGLKLGADVYLAKPFEREELFVRIQKLIELRQALINRYKTNMNNIPQRLFGEPTFEKEDSFIQRVYKILGENLGDEEFGILELSRSLGMSRSQLYRKFSALTEISVHQFIRKLRLQNARELLLTGNKNVTEVAMETGFKNLSHFSKVFYEEFGIAPSRVRPENNLLKKK